MTKATSRWAELIAARALGTEASDEPDQPATGPAAPLWAQQVADRALGTEPDTTPAA